MLITNPTPCKLNFVKERNTRWITLNEMSSFIYSYYFRVAIRISIHFLKYLEGTLIICKFLCESDFWPFNELWILFVVKLRYIFGILMCAFNGMYGFVEWQKRLDEYYTSTVRMLIFQFDRQKETLQVCVNCYLLNSPRTPHFDVCLGVCKLVL